MLRASVARRLVGLAGVMHTKRTPGDEALWLVWSGVALLAQEPGVVSVRSRVRLSP